MAVIPAAPGCLSARSLLSSSAVTGELATERRHVDRSVDVEAASA